MAVKPAVPIAIALRAVKSMPAGDAIEAVIGGIDSVASPPDERWEAWTRLARDLPADKLEVIIVPAKLEDLPALSKQILEGKIRGRVVVEIGG